LPNYDEPPIAFVPYHDGTIALVAIDPAEWIIGNPLPNGKEKELYRLRDFDKTTRRSCMLSADGKILVAVGDDPATAKNKNPTAMVVIWDVSKLHERAMTKAKEPSHADLEKFWESLAVEYLPYARKAMLTLHKSPKQAVAFLGKKLGPPADLNRIVQLIKELDDAKFSTRDKAIRDLERIGHVAQPLLQKALKNKPSEEVRERIEQLLKKLAATVGREELRYLRVVDVLEHIKTPAAREVLQRIAGGGYGPSYAEAAKAALQRTAQQP
jgi:hypothetical protein